MTPSPNPPPLHTHPQPQPQSESQSQISNPRRLLILAPSTQSTSIIPPFLRSLTGAPVTDPPTSAPTTTTSGDTPEEKPSGTSFAGYTTHAPFSIRNKYYTAEVPVWVDEIPLSVPGGTETGDSLRENKREGSEQTPSLWKSEFCSDEAKVVRDAIGGIVVCVLNPEDRTSTLPSGSEAGGEDPGQRPDVQSIKEYILSIASVKAKIEEERGTISDVAGLVVLVGKRQPDNNVKSGGNMNDDEGILDDLSPVGGEEETPFTPTWWEDQLSDLGVMEFEVVDWDPRADGEAESRNKFGGLSCPSYSISKVLIKAELQGMRRIKEALETHDWASNPEDGDIDDDLEEHLLGLDDDDDTDGFSFEVNELEREMLGLRMAIGQDEGDEVDEKDDERKVDSMETLMLRMQAIKGIPPPFPYCDCCSQVPIDMSADLPENERKTFAAKAVRDIMKEI